MALRDPSVVVRSSGQISAIPIANDELSKGGKERHMYGTIARFQVKPGMEAKLTELQQEYNTTPVPGFVVTYIYQMDTNPREYYLVAVFESQEAYRANASSPEQDTRYRKFRALLTADPEWHDGEIVSMNRPASG
jgi:quinol monooxygenase YgiN